MIEALQSNPDATFIAGTALGLLVLTFLAYGTLVPRR